ncbi:MAG: YraN family protein [Myxococcota bacterium]
MVTFRGSATRRQGHAAELRMAGYLAARGLEVLAQGVERAGAEIDLIAVDRRHGTPEIVFVEVRTRADATRGLPLETVDRAKQRQIRRAATAWLVEQELWEQVAVRFDVVGAVRTPTGWRVSWIEDAFGVD